MSTMNEFAIMMIGLVIILLAIVCVILFFYDAISEHVQDKFLRNLGRILADPSKQQLYDIFYKFNHADTLEWAQWIQTQDEDIQEMVFDEMVEYLSNPTASLNMVICEIVKAVVYLESENSFKALENFIGDAKRDWAKYKSISYAYEEAVYGMLDVDREAAFKLFLRHIKQKARTDDESYKEYLIDAIDEIEDDNEFSSHIKTIIMESVTNSRTKLYTLRTYEERELANDTEFYLDILTTITKQYLIKELPSLDENGVLVKATINEDEEESEEDHTDSDVEFIGICVLKLYDHAKENKALSIKMWKLLLEYCTVGNTLLETTIINILKREIISNSFIMNPEYLFKIFNTVSAQNKLDFSLALAAKYHFTDEEKSIITKYEGLAEIQKERAFKDVIDMIEVMPVDTSFEAPIFIKQSLEKLKSIFAEKSASPRIKTIFGNANLDKFLLMKAISKHLNLDILILNVDSLMFAPDKIKELQKRLTEDKKKISLVYFHNSKDFLKSISENDASIELEKEMLKAMKEFTKIENIRTILSIDYGEKDIEKDHPALHKYIEPANHFNMIMDLGNVSEPDREYIYGVYKKDISSIRENDVKEFSEIIEHTNYRSAFDYALYILNYIRSSLLTHGRLITMDLYEEYLNSEELKPETYLPELTSQAEESESTEPSSEEATASEEAVDPDSAAKKAREDALIREAMGLPPLKPEEQAQASAEPEASTQEAQPEAKEESPEEKKAREDALIREAMGLPPLKPEEQAQASDKPEASTQEAQPEAKEESPEEKKAREDALIREAMGLPPLKPEEQAQAS